MVLPWQKPVFTGKFITIGIKNKEHLYKYNKIIPGLKMCIFMINVNNIFVLAYNL